MLSISDKNWSYWTAPEPLIKRYYDLLGFTDLGRKLYFYSAIDMRRDSVEKIDNKIRALLAQVDGELITQYSSVGPDRQFKNGIFLEEVLGSHELDDKLHDLRFKFSKGGCRVHLILSRRKVLLRFIGGPEHEPLKKSLKKCVEGVLKKNQAPFLKHIIFLTLFMFAAFGLMWGADILGARFSIRLAFNIVAILSTFVLLPLIGAHYKGVYLPHTTITLAEAKKTKRALSIVEIATILSLLIELAQLIKDCLYRQSASLQQPTVPGAFI
jgi:hypothetical protein